MLSFCHHYHPSLDKPGDDRIFCYMTFTSISIFAQYHEPCTAVGVGKGNVLWNGKQNQEMNGDGLGHDAVNKRCSDFSISICCPSLQYCFMVGDMLQPYCLALYDSQLDTINISLSVCLSLSISLCLSLPPFLSLSLCLSLSLSRT